MAASNASVSSIAKAAETLRVAWPSVTVVASSDCSNLRPGLFLEAVPAGDERERPAVLAKLRAQVKDAYLRECRAKPHSRVLLGLPAVDPSIAQVPASAVNWTDMDRISTVHRLAAGGYVWVRRRYDPKPEDPREGRREEVWFFESSAESARQIDGDCTDPAFARRGPLLALSCAREAAADQLLHTTMAYRIGQAKPLRSVPRCRAPRFLSEREFTCQEESMTNAGEIRFTPKRVRVD